MSSPASPSASVGTSWWERAHAEPGFLVAYFSPEFGVDAGLPVYAGGLGILAGDHLKAADDLGVPMVAVGLFYTGGYFRQEIVRGRQREAYPRLDPAGLGLELEQGAGGEPLHVDVELAGERVLSRVWRRDVGAVRLYLLDTDVEGNSPAARAVTDALYGGDREHRIRQEVVLGVGGSRALAALGIEPSVYHLNEGHAAFLSLERIRAHVQDGGASFDDALELVRRSTVFTTHTPVPEGNERFTVRLARRYLEGLARACGVGVDELLALGLVEGDPSFGLTPLALRTSGYSNGVSALHGAVSRSMWRAVWPAEEPDEVPIGHVTNAVHAPTWVSDEVERLLAKAGVDVAAAPGEQGWDRALDVDPAALWEAHSRARARLVEGVAERAVGRTKLDPDALTIVFARRFAPYKRAALVLADPDRLLELLQRPDRPVQLVYTGKAHPLDRVGKRLLADIVRVSKSRAAGGRIAFVPDYDMRVAALLVHGADVWLNNPRRPEEASGTSGMKAALNGGLNLSVLDGWWPEAYSPDIGWAIAESVSDGGDEREAEELLRLLEAEVVPAFYERGAEGVPARWVDMMRASIATVGAEFNASRMVAEYAERFYLPAHRAGSVASA